MDYTNDEIIQALSNLIDIYSNIYDLSMNKLLPLEIEGIKDPKTFDTVVKKINRLKTKEKRLLEKLDSSEFYYEWTDVINGLIDNTCGPDDIKATALDSRLQGVFNEKLMFENSCEEYMMSFQMPDEDEEEEYPIDIDFEMNVLNFYAPLQLQFLKHLKTLEVDNLIPDEKYSNYDEEKAKKEIEFLTKELQKFSKNGIGEENINYRAAKRKLDNLEMELKCLPLYKLTKKLETLDKQNPEYRDTAKQIKSLTSQLREKATVHEEFIKYKYYISLIFPWLEQELVTVGYNPDNITIEPNELKAKSYDIPLEEFIEKQNAAKENYVNATFESFISVVGREDFDTKNDIAMLNVFLEEMKFSLSLLETKKIAEFVSNNLSGQIYSVNPEATKHLKELSHYAYSTLFAREDFNEDMLEKEISTLKPDLDEKEFDTLFKLANISKEIYDTFALLYTLENAGYKESEDYQEGIDFLRELTEYEKTYLEKLQIYSDTSEEVARFIELYITSLYQMESDSYTTDISLATISVKKRVMNLLFNTEIPDISIYKGPEVPYYILKNHQLQTLQAFEKYAKAKEEYLKFKYSQIASDAGLTDEFILTEGDITKSVILDDESMAKLLEIDEDEYAYDKSLILSKTSYEIMDAFTEISSDEILSPFEKAGLDYQTIALKIAFEHADKDQVDQLESNYQLLPTYDSSILYDRLNIVFDKKQKEKTLEKRPQ